MRNPWYSYFVQRFWGHSRPLPRLTSIQIHRPMKYLLKTILLAVAFTASAQNNPDYTRAVEIGLGELQKGQCKPCLEAYERAFAISKHSSLSHLRAARCAQLCQDEAKALAFADTALSIGFVSTNFLLEDGVKYPELIPFRNSELGKKTLLKSEALAKASGFNLALAKELDLLKESDQKYRRENDEYRSKYGSNSPEYQQFMRDYVQSDSLCLVRTEAIIKQYGYPGKSMVGADRQDIVWLIIQHAPLAKQELYYPLIEEAAQKGELNKSAWALLVDRIKMHKGQPQVYGSQVVRDETTGGWKFHEIEDEPNVNKRRAEVGLKPLEQYAERMGVNWKPK